MKPGETLFVNFKNEDSIVIKRKHMDEHPFETKEFYDLMQSYRIAPMSDQQMVTTFYKQVQHYCIEQLKIVELETRNEMLKSVKEMLQKMIETEQQYVKKLEKS